VQQYKEKFPEIRRMARESAFGIALDASEKSALEVTPEERQRQYATRWDSGGFNFLVAFKDLLVNEEANTTAAEFVRAKIRQTVKDPAVAERLIPHDHPLGTKRICIDTNYYETYNRDTVQLIDIRTAPIEEITPQGVRTQHGEYEVDSIVFATGFDAMTGPLLNIDIRGRAGVSLRRQWENGPRTYLGLAVAGFPNLFTITGPGSPSVLSNMLVSIEQHVDWIADCVGYMRQSALQTIEATPEAEAAWVAHVNEVGNKTLFPRANSWYVGANIPGKPRVFMPYAGGVGAYAQKCREVTTHGYQGFTLSAGGRVPAGHEG
jgi:cyclohexanone monooxygenase